MYIVQQETLNSMLTEDPVWSLDLHWITQSSGEQVRYQNLTNYLNRFDSAHLMLFLGPDNLVSNDYALCNLTNRGKLIY